MRIIIDRIRSGPGKDRSLERHAWHVLLHCSGNILHAITQRVTDGESEQLMVNRNSLDGCYISKVLFVSLGKQVVEILSLGRGLALSFYRQVCIEHTVGNPTRK